MMALLKTINMLLRQLLQVEVVCYTTQMILESFALSTYESGKRNDTDECLLAVLVRG